MPELGQMTLQVGGEDLDDLRMTGSFSIGGKLNAAVELPKGADLRALRKRRAAAA